MPQRSNVRGSSASLHPSRSAGPAAPPGPLVAAGPLGSQRGGEPRGVREKEGVGGHTYTCVACGTRIRFTGSSDVFDRHDLECPAGGWA